MSLADKMIKKDIDYYGDWYKADDVKQALKELQELIRLSKAVDGFIDFDELKEIFGEELLK